MEQLEFVDQLDCQKSGIANERISTTDCDSPPQKKFKRDQFVLGINELANTTFLDSGPAVRLKDREIVIKSSDIWNNTDGYKRLKNEIKAYQILSKHNLKCVPRYHGNCRYHVQHFIAIGYIAGSHCG